MGYDDSGEAGLIVGSVVGALVLLTLVSAIAYFLMKRSKTFFGKSGSSCDQHYLNVTTPLCQTGGFSRHKTYVDPHTYEDPQQAVREFTREINQEHIAIEAIIGGGEFGDVCKAKLRVPGKPEKMVAVKTLKAGASDKNRLDFLTEASIMGQFHHPNVIYLEGVITKTSPIMIVTEYMENGSLDVFLRNNDGKLSIVQLLSMLKGIASGMAYLADMFYVHRDLAARNILVDSQLVCKVSDFGLSREVRKSDSDYGSGGYTTTKGGKLPIRWTAPEALAYRKFTTASDVWSFGLLVWEVISFGERPYWNWSNRDVIRSVNKGYRLPPPMGCPESVYQLMLDCWQFDRNHRPRFHAVSRTIDKLMQGGHLLKKMAVPQTASILEHAVLPDPSRLSTVPEWLASLKLERYTDNFLKSGIHSIHQVAQIGPNHLCSLGISLAGHQKKILASIQSLKMRISDPDPCGSINVSSNDTGLTDSSSGFASSQTVSKTSVDLGFKQGFLV